MSTVCILALVLVPRRLCQALELRPTLARQTSSPCVGACVELHHVALAGWEQQLTWGSVWVGSMGLEISLTVVGRYVLVRITG